MATRRARSGLTAATLLSIASLTTAQIAQQCPTSDICYSLSIPSTTADSGTGDIYFQLSAPTTYTWAALGQGSSMSGANIFVMYTDSTGQNVTLSPRLGVGNVQPQHDTAAQVTLLEGSGVVDGVMTANVRCSNCDSWSGGSMDFSSSSASWIYAWKSGDSLDSDELSANINQHDQASSFNFDLSAAQNSENVNPFVTSTGATSGSGSGTSDSGSVPATCTPIADSAGASGTAGSSTASATASSSSGPPWGSGPPPWANGNGDDNGQHGPPSWVTDGDNGDNGGSKLLRRQSSACPSGYAPISASSSGSASGGGPISNTLILAHAVLACLAFVALFPIGGILIRVASFTGLVWVHAALQIFAYVLYIVAFGIGVWMATNMRYLTSAHPIIGIVLFIVLLGQPLLGLLHHRLFKKYQSRTLWSYMHIGIGRIAILLGIVNGGLGLQLAGARGGSVIAYGVIAGLMALIYIAAIIFGEMKRKRAASDSRGRRLDTKGERPPRYSEEEMGNLGSRRST